MIALFFMKYEFIILIKMCRGCRLTEEKAGTITELRCVPCIELMSLPDLPICTRLYCWGCKALLSLPELPVYTVLSCGGVHYWYLSQPYHCVLI
jgi:hypothetical protein